MEINFTANQYYASTEAIVRDIYKPIIDYLKFLIGDQQIDAAVCRFKNELLLPEVCNPNFVGFNIRYNTQIMLQNCYVIRHHSLHNREYVPVMVPSPPVFRTRIETTSFQDQDHFLEIE